MASSLRVAQETELDQYGGHGGPEEDTEGSLLDASVAQVEGLVELLLYQGGESLALRQVLTLGQIPKDQL